jgi:hypothetical protein
MNKPRYPTTDELLASIHAPRRGGIVGRWNGKKGAEPPKLTNSRARRQVAPHHKGPRGS